MSAAGRLRSGAKRLPGVARVHRTLAAVRAERDAFRAERDALRSERDRLAVEAEALRAERAVAPTRSEILRTPSFVALLEKSKRQRELARDEHGWVPPIWRHNAKDAGYALAAELGIPHPRVHWRGGALADVDWEALPDRVVLKSVDGSSTHGVFPLRREGSAWRSLFDGWRAEPGQLADHVAEVVAARGAADDHFLVEELLARPGDADALPYDWKVYCFGGQPRLVLQKDLRSQRRNTAAVFKFYDAAFADLGPLRHPDRVDPALPPPDRPGALLDAAGRIASAVDAPFVRVDLFEGVDGPVFGELTPHPGGDQWYGTHLDAELGRAWEAAEVARETTRRLRASRTDEALR